MRFNPGNVTYSSFQTQKAVFVPLLNQKFTFGTKMRDPVWKQAVLLDDFVVFLQNTVPEEKSESRMFRTDTFLYIAFFFSEKKESLVDPGSTDDWDLWHGDMAELFFGSIFPDPWLLQLGVGIGGGRYDSAGSYSSWRSCSFCDEDGWYAEIEIPLSMLTINNGGFSFNLCRQASNRKEISVWSPLTNRFHEVENFGTILFCDYNQAYFLRTGQYVPEALSRVEYENLQKEFLVKANTVTHGPYLSNPTETSMTITWETAGRVPAFVEYKKKGSDRFLTVDVGYRCGILFHENLHSVNISELEPNTDYEYRLVTLSPVTDIPVRHPGSHSFSTLNPGEKNFSFVCVSDLHSNVAQLKCVLNTPEARSADFLVVLGDSLSHAAGKNAFYDGIIDPLTDSAAQTKPLVFVRGNHEMLGIFADEYFNCMRHHSGNTWYAFRHGHAFFLVLDSGIDHQNPDSRVFHNATLWNDQRKFLREVVRSPDYTNAKFRVVFIHIPPCKKEVYEQKAFRAMFAEFIDSTSPLPHMVVCGHVHHYVRANPGENQFASTSDKNYREKVPRILPLPFTLVANSNDTIFEGKIASDHIAVKIFKPDGREYDSFTIPTLTADKKQGAATRKKQ